MNPSSLEKSNSSSFLVQQQTRKNSGASATMRKYQQLALAIVSVISLMAFLFYKHEYDRLRYTLEYLDVFGTVPTDISLSSSCGGTIPRKLNTAPHTWVKLRNDIAVYSVFWDEGNGLTYPLIRALATIKKSNEKQAELSSSLLFETGEVTTKSVCSIEEIHSKISEKEIMKTESEFRIADIVCRSDHYHKDAPYLTQFKIDGKEWSNPLFVQESKSFKSVSNISCVCVYSQLFPTTSLKLIEFITFYNALGVERFVFYGSLLTPLVRRLLDKYSDEIRISFEEKSFLLPDGFHLEGDKLRALIENDCVYRHRDSYENVLVLKLNEFLVPRNKNSLHEVLTSVGGKSTSTTSEFHFQSQSVCLDPKHSKNSDMLLSSQIRILTGNNEVINAVLRPHLVENALVSKTSGSPGFQNVPSSVATIYSFEICSDGNHAETDHLPSVAKFVDAISKSLLYRKWKINS